MNPLATRQRLSEVLGSDDTDRAIDAAVRSFWSRAKALSAGRHPGAAVVDLARWAEARDRATR
jgi:hypothetical protein